MNIIKIPFEHKMFDIEFSGYISNFIYDEFSLIYTLNGKPILGLTVFYKSNGGDMSGTEIYLVRLRNEWIEDVVYKIELDDNVSDGMNVYCNSTEKKYTDIGHDIAQLVLRTIVYIMNTPRDKIVKPKTTKKQIEEKKIVASDKENKIYLLDEIVEYVNVNGLKSNGAYTINCPCWSVRGHYRHYKNGKVIFVKNYEKGKEKGKVKPKRKIYTV